MLAIGGTAIASHLVKMLQHGPTYGAQRALLVSLLYTTVVGALTAATYVATWKGDRDHAWRRAAWLFAAFAGVLYVVSVVAPLYR